MANINLYPSPRDAFKNIYKVDNVANGYKYWVDNLLNKAMGMFTYTGLPETLPADQIEYNLITKGFGTICEVDGDLWIPYQGNTYWSGNPYWVDNKAVIANPVLNTKNNYIDGENMAIIWGSKVDKLNKSSILMETIQRYARLLSDLESTYYSILIARRASRATQTANNKAAQAINNFFNKLEQGETKAIMNESMMVNTIKGLEINAVNDINFSESRDFLIDCFAQEIGLSTLEEKKERMVTGELTADNDRLNYNYTQFLNQRKENVRKINNVFGTNIEVKEAKEHEQSERQPTIYNE